MNERGSYDPSRDPEAIPNVAGARWDAERYQWMMPSSQASLSHVGESNLPATRPEGTPGIVIRKTQTHEERFTVEGDSLPALLNLLSGASHGVQQQAPTQYEPEQTASTQSFTEGYPGWDRPPEYPGAPETKPLALQDSLGGKIEAKEKTTKRSKVVRAVGGVGLAVVGLQASVWAGAVIAGPEHPKIALYHYTNPIRDIKNVQNWGPVKLVTEIGGFISH